MKQWLYLAVFGLFAFAGLLVFKAPAIHMLSLFPAPTAIQFRDVKGSVGRGSALLEYRGTRLARLEWTVHGLSPWACLRINLRFQRQTAVAQADMSACAGGEITLADMSGGATMGAMSGLFQLSPDDLGGELRLEGGLLVFTRDGLRDATGRLVWSNASINFLNARVGRVDMDLGAAGGTIRGAISVPEGSLIGVRGEAVVERSGAFALKLAVDSRTNQILENTLLGLGGRRDGGWIRIHRRGQL